MTSLGVTAVQFRRLCFGNFSLSIQALCLTASLCGLQSQAREVRLAKMGRADRITASGVEELPVERGASRCGSRRSIVSAGPGLVCEELAELGAFRGGEHRVSLSEITNAERNKSVFDSLARRGVVVPSVLNGYPPRSS